MKQRVPYFGLCEKPSIVADVSLPGIKVNDTFLVPFAENNTFTLVEVDVLTVKFHQLAHTHTSGSQYVNDGKVADFGATVTELFDILIAQYLFYLCSGLNLVYSADGAFDDVIFFFKPSKE